MKKERKERSGRGEVGEGRWDEEKKLDGVRLVGTYDMINPAVIVFDFLAELSLSRPEIRHFSVWFFRFVRFLYLARYR